MRYNNNTNDRLSLSGFCLTALLWFFSAQLSAQLSTQDNNNYQLDSSSDRCVALRQGQTCYKNLTINWRAPQSGDYCLYQLQNDSPLQCWQQQNQNSIKIAFASDKDATYVLRRENTSPNLAELTITVSWVYEPKPEPSSGWRLF